VHKKTDRKTWEDGVEESATQAKAKKEAYPTILAMKTSRSFEVDKILALDLGVHDILRVR
jgi:hypothetical protein